MRLRPTTKPGSCWRLGTLVIAVALSGACGGNGGTSAAGADMFEWTEGGQTKTATTMSFSVGATMDGSLFALTIQGIAPIGATCILSGRFADAVPPAAGTYPFVVLLDGTTEVPQPDGTFTGMCQPSMMVAGGFVLDPSVDGEVVLSRSGADRVEGTFEMQGSTMAPANATQTTTFTGRFKVGCNPQPGTPCGPLSVATVGTCADFQACCASADSTMTAGCMFELDGATAGGDAACGRKLAAMKSLYCP